MDKMIYRSVIMYLKNGLVIEGFVFEIDDKFLAIKDQGEFEYSVVNIDEISIIRGRYQKTEQACDSDIPLGTCCVPPIIEGGSIKPPNPVRLAAKVSKRPNDFSIPLSPEQNKYEAPSFVRQTPSER